MRAYVGQSRSRAAIALLTANGVGECTNRGEWPPRRTPYFLDNGAYSDWTAGKPWDADAWLADVASAERHGERPVFVVAPDIVGAGMTSLAHSLKWLPRVAHLSPYLAVQDGMGAGDVAPVLGGFSGVFVGGTLEWKLATGLQWVDFAHARGLPCHIGRVGTLSRLRWAREIGADSVDSSFPLWTKERLRAFLRVLGEKQRRIW